MDEYRYRMLASMRRQVDVDTGRYLTDTERLMLRHANEQALRELVSIATTKVAS